MDPSVFVWSASSALILLKFNSQEENATNRLWLGEWEDYHFRVIRKSLSRVIDFVLTAEINEASSDLIICSKDRQYIYKK